MKRIDLTMEVLQNILSSINRDMLFDEYEEQISNGDILFLLNSSEDPNPMKVITTVEEFKTLRNDLIRTN